MQTGHLILEDLSGKLKKLGPDYYETNIKTIDETQIHVVDLDKSIFEFRKQGPTLEGLQNMIIRAARLYESYQAKLAAIEEQREKLEEEKKAKENEEESEQPEVTQEDKKPTTKRRTRSKKS